MVKLIFAIIGAVLTITGLLMGGYLVRVNQQAESLDINKHGLGSNDPCINPLPNIELANRSMSESESQVLRVRLSNMGTQTCVAEVTLNAPDFDIGSAPVTRRVNVPPGSASAQVLWVISPKKLGTFEILVEAGGDSDVIGVTVVNVFGLSPWQVQLFSFLSALLGPMLTIPWWYEQWGKRRK